MATMTRTDYEIFAEVAEKLDGNPRDSYSGKFMFGKSCVGVDFNHLNDFVRFRMAIEQDLPNFDWDEMTTDSMGLGTVYYWKGIVVEVGDDYE